MGYHIGISVEIGEHDDLADSGIFVAAKTPGSPSAPAEQAAPSGPAKILFLEIPFDQRLFDSSARIDERQHDVRFAFFHPNATRKCPCSAAEQASDDTAQCTSAPAGIAVRTDNIGLQEVIGSHHLAQPDILSVLKLALFLQCPFHRTALHRTTSADHGETTRTLNENADDLFWAAEIQFTPPFVVRLDHRNRTEISGAPWNFRRRAILCLATGRFALCHNGLAHQAGHRQYG